MNVRRSHRTHRALPEPPISRATEGSIQAHPGAALAIAEANEARTQGGRIAALFGRLRTQNRAVFAAAIAVSGGLWLLPSVAQATPGTTYLPQGQITGSPTSHFGRLFPESVALDESTGHIYVADSGTGSVYDFASPSDSSPTQWTGANTPARSFGEESVAVAVDNSPAGEGDVYVAVAHQEPNRGEYAHIDKFDSAGNLIETFGDTVNEEGEPAPNGQLAGLQTPAGSFSPLWLLRHLRHRRRSGHGRPLRHRRRPPGYRRLRLLRQIPPPDHRYPAGPLLRSRKRTTRP